MIEDKREHQKILEFFKILGSWDVIKIGINTVGQSKKSIIYQNSRWLIKKQYKGTFT